jgi:ethanolamine ammonia-lyase small subunit
MTIKTDAAPDRAPPDRALPDRQPSEDSQPSKDSWDSLRQLTAARIGLARSGASLATAPLLAFRLAHSRARDAVQEPLDAARLAAALSGLSDPVLVVASAAETRSDYLLRPDLGRRLGGGAEAVLAPHAGHYDIAFVIADGLSARAVQTHAAPILAGVIEKLCAAPAPLSWRIAPLVIVHHGRVAIGDAIAAALDAACAAVLIGERPGLSAADSMGAYLTFRPHAHATDADRNCISNIRPEGLGYADAAFKIAAMLTAMRAAGVSGVQLKDETGRLLDGTAR